MAFVDELYVLLPNHPVHVPPWIFVFFLRLFAPAKECLRLQKLPTVSYGGARQGLIGDLGGCQARGAASAHRLRPHAAPARPRQGGTPLQGRVPAATRRWRAAQQLPLGQTSGQPKLHALPLVVAQVPPGPVVQRAGGARWLPPRQIGRRLQHRQQPGGSGGRARP